MRGELCSICKGALAPYREAGGVAYFECAGCGSLLAERSALDALDGGSFPRRYDESYWDSELGAARERAYGPALARVSEMLLYARRPVRRFLDVGSGPGFLLDALATYLPASKAIFWGVETYPPPTHTSNPRYVVGSIDSLPGTFDAGLCMEVVEHLTPRMVSSLGSSLATLSELDSIFLFNTALPAFVKSADPGYLDPYVRGHVASYSLKAMGVLLSPFGFRVSPLRGKDWAYVVEYRPTSAEAPMEDRIWTALPENKQILADPEMGSVLYLLGLDAARAYAPAADPEPSRRQGGALRAWLERTLRYGK
jgi:hypothetical protein